VRQGGLTTKAFAERFKMSYAQARYFILNREVSRRSGPKPFFSPEEESLLVKYLIINATIGRGLYTEALCKVCGDYLSEMSTERQAAARALFNGKLTPGRSWVTCFLHPELRKYRVGTLEEGRGRNARQEVVARWFGLLSLLYRDLKITSPRQVWNMNETHIHARTSAMTGRSEVIGQVGMTKPEVLLPPFASGVGACTAAFGVSAAGVVAPYFIVVDGKVAGHSVVTETSPEGIKKETALASFLNDAAVVWRRSPPGFDKVVFEVWAEHFAAFVRSYYTQEDKLSSLDGAKVHLSLAGLLPSCAQMCT